jgi:hypothetical protein
VPVFADTVGGISAEALTIMVSGPGQNVSDIARKTLCSSSVSCTSGAASSVSAMCTIRGSVRGRPFATKMDNTASASSALAPRPYTVCENDDDEDAGFDMV